MSVSVSAEIFPVQHDLVSINGVAAREAICVFDARRHATQFLEHVARGGIVVEPARPSVGAFNSSKAKPATRRAASLA